MTQSNVRSRLSAAGEPDNFVAGMLGTRQRPALAFLPTYAKVVDEFLRGAIQKLETLRNSHSLTRNRQTHIPQKIGNQERTG